MIEVIIVVIVFIGVFLLLPWIALACGFFFEHFFRYAEWVLSLKDEDEIWPD